MAGGNGDSLSEIYLNDKLDNINRNANLPTDSKQPDSIADEKIEINKNDTSNSHQFSPGAYIPPRFRKFNMAPNRNKNSHVRSLKSFIPWRRDASRSVVHVANCKHFVGESQNKPKEDEMGKEAPDAQTAPVKLTYTDLVFDFDVPYILEMYDFCPCLVTVDVFDMFEESVNNTLQILRVNDVHLLLIFSTVTQAAQVLEMPFATCKLRFLRDACPLSKYIAKRNGLVLRKNQLTWRMHGNITP